MGAWDIVGIDCATEEARTGLAHGVVDDGGRLTVERVTLGTAGESAAGTVSAWIAGSERFVIALDAPLGWPAALSDALREHRAGEPIGDAAQVLFRRQTDRFVHKRLGRLPLEVGADRIARTAHAALRLLERIRALSGRPIGMAWEPGEASGAIEVYPAATLRTRGLTGRGYKASSSKGRRARSAILRAVGDDVKLRVSRDVMIEDDNLLDAMLCVVAGADFALGRCLPPEDVETARREGWIWFASDKQQTLF